MVQNIKKIKGNTHFVNVVFQKFHFNLYEFGIIGKLVKLVPFVVLGPIVLKEKFETLSKNQNDRQMFLTRVQKCLHISTFVSRVES